MSDVNDRHFEGIEVTLALLGAQVKALRHALTPAPSAKPAPLVLPEQCVGVPAESCGLRNEDAQLPVASFADPHAWRCGGCGHQGSALKATG